MLNYQRVYPILILVDLKAWLLQPKSMGSLVAANAEGGTFSSWHSYNIDPALPPDPVALQIEIEEIEVQQLDGFSKGIHVSFIWFYLCIYIYINIYIYII